MTIEMVNGVVTKVGKSRKAPKSAAEPAPAKSKSKKAKAAEPALSTEPVATPAPETPAPVAEKPTKRGKLALVKDTPAPEASAALAASAAKPKRKPRTIAAEAASAAEHAQSLGGLADAFTGKLVADGKTPGTVASYRNELNLALAHFRSATRVTELTKEAVLEYFLSRPVMKLRSGRAKSPLSVDKSRRVLRQALAWAHQQGWLKESIVPELPPAS